MSAQNRAHGPTPKEGDASGRRPAPIGDVDLVVLGASGDLAGRLLFPALARLVQRRRLEGLRVWGYAREDWTTSEFLDHLHARMPAEVRPETWERLASRVNYLSGDLTTETLRPLANGVRGTAIFYLALPPTMFADAAVGLAEAGLADERQGWRRLVVEKPFGTDVPSAVELNERLHERWREEQIFRIDHFLGKETVQNLLVFRFANRFLEPVLTSAHVDHVEITVAETLGLEGRSRYYDGSGALRDMIQNHLFQLFTLTAMEPPGIWDTDVIRDHKLEVLRSVRALDPGGGAMSAARGQYRAGVVDGEPVPGYREEPDIPADSRTETFAAVRLNVDNWRWKDVPFYLRSGKRLAAPLSEIAIKFRHPPAALFPGLFVADGPANWLVFRLGPTEAIDLVALAKRPGFDLAAHPVTLHAPYARSSGAEASAYEQLLLDVMEGDHTPFLRFDAVEAAWEILQPVLDHWKHGEPELYDAGTDGPASQHAILEPGHSWRPIGSERAAARPTASGR